ncbi:MAG TPA: hypothetical protein VHZ75_02740 [Solirubrobacteraceae bacterium]|jgi:hypothetical protein|nr:hypothetical protein [Solirubrobacteraceae bacterium]
MTDVFDDLERDLATAVRLKAGRRPRRARRGSALVLTATLLVSGGALAATGLVPSGSPVPEYDAHNTPTTGPGVVEGHARILPLRAADPEGGPPWALRTFRSTRGLDCVQFGRVQAGRFGLVTATVGEPDHVAFRELRAVPGVNSLCSGVSRDGLAVIRGLRQVVITGGASDPHRCPSHKPHGDCPITAVRILRYGLLGPQARTARYVAADGTVLRRMKIRADTGGAYLFVTATDPIPFRLRDERQRRLGDIVQRTLADAQRRGVPPQQAIRNATRDARRLRSVTSTLRVSETIVAGFANGANIRVAGRGRSPDPLPGVTPRRSAPASSVRAPLTVTRLADGSRSAFRLRVDAPVAIRRADRHYTLTVTGPSGPDCARAIPKGGPATTRDIARGEAVTFVVSPRYAGEQRDTWCPGTFTARIGYQTPGTDFAGLLVATHRFHVS